MNNKEIMGMTEQFVLHTYNRFPLAIDHGEGVKVYDADENEYLDFMAGIAVYALGYQHPAYNEALVAQLHKALHTSNLYYHEPLALAAKALVTSTGLSKAFFTNSGAEAIEGALKSAKKYAYTRDGHAGHEIVAMRHSFHGRTVGALSVTGNAHYQDPFLPLMDGVRFADFNDLASVEAAVTEKTCAILLETVQGEGGIYPADPAFLKGVRKLCDDRDILLILDEIQCGMGRTGSMWAYEQYGIQPDILTTAKALGCGVPVGAFVLSEKAAKASLVPGDHGTTYGGNPFVCAAVAAVFDIFEKEHIVARTKVAAAYLEKKLDALMAAHPESIKAHRGLGLMRGLVLSESCPAGKIASKALEKGLLIITAGGNVLRFVPPLIIESEDVDKAIAILDECFSEA